MTAVMVPDPRRYERVDEEDRKGWFDKLESLFFPDAVMAQAAAQIAGLPIYSQQQQIGNAEAYVRSRKPEIDAMLDGALTEPTFDDKSEEFLESLATDQLGFVILVVDIVGSTTLSQTVGNRTYARVIATVLHELSLTIPAFHGHVLKYTGDGLIAYFPEPSFITKNDLGLDCALTLRFLVYEAINPALEARGLPSLGIRIGLDSGEAIVVTMGHPATKQHKDVIGATVSLAAKIQALAESGAILVGQTVDRNLHIQWRENLQEIGLADDWKYLDIEGNPYRVLRVGRDPDAGPRVGES